MRGFLLRALGVCDDWAWPAVSLCLMLASSAALAFPIVWMARSGDVGHAAQATAMRAAASLVCPSLGGR